MTTIYYVETKTYWQDAFGADYQIADAGELPIISTTKKKAIERAKWMENTYIEKFGYKTTIPDSEYPYKKIYCLYAVRQENKERRMRHEIRVYKTTTI